VLTLIKHIIIRAVFLTNRDKKSIEEKKKQEEALPPLLQYFDCLISPLLLIKPLLISLMHVIAPYDRVRGQCARVSSRRAIDVTDSFSFLEILKKTWPEEEEEEAFKNKDDGLVPEACERNLRRSADDENVKQHEPNIVCSETKPLQTPRAEEASIARLKKKGAQ
jgi:hypothetical protein